MTATGPTVAASRTAGTAEMIGPMIGTSSNTPAMTDSRTAYRPKIGSTSWLRTMQPDERRDADREAEEELAAHPLAEVALDGLDDRPGVEPPASPAATRSNVATRRRLVLEDVGDPDRQDEIGEDARRGGCSAPVIERQQERQVGAATAAARRPGRSRRCALSIHSRIGARDLEALA